MTKVAVSSSTPRFIERPAASNNFQGAFLELVVKSYETLAQRDFFTDFGGPDATAEEVFKSLDRTLLVHIFCNNPAPFHVRNTIDEGWVFVYGNLAALSLFKAQWRPEELPSAAKTAFSPQSLIGLNSRHSAERQAQSDRDDVFDRLRKDGWIEGYNGFRVDFEGRPFPVQGAEIWQVEDSSGQLVAEAASFKVPRL